MKKLLGILVLGLLLSSNAYAETGKHLNWCKQDTKIKYPFYIHGKGKIKKHKSSKKLKDAQNKIVIIYNYGGGNAQKYHGICRKAAKNFAGLAGHKIGNLETIWWYNDELKKVGGGGNEPFWVCNEGAWMLDGKVEDQPQNVGKYYWKCINKAITEWNAEKRYQKTVEVVKNFIKAGVPPKQIFVSGVSAGGVDAIRMAANHPDLINAAIPFHPANWGYHPAGGRRTFFINQMKNAERVDMLYINSNADGGEARKIRPEDSLWMKEIPGVEWLETASYNENNEVITPDGKKCNHQGKWTIGTLYHDRTFTYDSKLWAIAKDRPDAHDMVNQKCIQYYWPQVLDYITARIEATQ